MKKFFAVALVFAAAVALVAAMGCSSTPTEPDAGATQTAVANANASATASAIAAATANATVYAFESAGQVSDWGFDTDATTVGIIAVSHGAANGVGGTGALVADCDLTTGTAGKSQGAIMRTNDISMTGRTISVSMYVPAGIINADTNNPAQLALYIQGDNPTPWSGWSDTSFNLTAAMADTWQTFTWAPTVAWASTCHRIGIQVRLGSTNAVPYYGDLYFDNIAY